jgi:hypothetical protein
MVPLHAEEAGVRPGGLAERGEEEMKCNHNAMLPNVFWLFFENITI